MRKEAMKPLLTDVGPSQANPRMPRLISLEDNGRPYHMMHCAHVIFPAQFPVLVLSSSSPGEYAPISPHFHSGFFCLLYLCPRRGSAPYHTGAHSV